MPEPWPANTKIKVQMNSARAAFNALGCVASAVDPIAILEIGIFPQSQPLFFFFPSLLSL